MFESFLILSAQSYKNQIINNSISFDNLCSKIGNLLTLL